MPMIKEEEDGCLVTSWAHFKSSKPRTSLAVLQKLYVWGVFSPLFPLLMLVFFYYTDLGLVI